MELNVFIKGKKINLIVLNKEIAQTTNWYNWFNDEKKTQFMQKHYYPNSKEDQIKFFESIVNSKTDIVLGIVHNEILIGVCSLNDINYLNKNCQISILIGEKINDDAVSLETFYLLMKHAFYTLNLEKVKMGQHEKLKLFNLKLSKLFGFQNEGILKKEIFKNGVYYDVILSSVFKCEFENKMNLSELFFVNKKFFKRIKSN